MTLKLRITRLCLIAAALMAIPCAGQMPAPPQPADPVIEDFNYPDSKALQARWKAMERSPPASLVEIRGRNAMAVRCNFDKSKADRVYYDLPVKLDLSRSRGVRLDVYCANPAPISKFTLYLHTPSGWHAASFGITNPDAWNTIRLDRSLMQAEGNIGGWGKVDAIRISAWRGKNSDTEFYIAGIYMLGADAPVVVVRPDSSAKSRPEEYKQAAASVKLTGRLLDEAGIEYCVIGDTELTAASLAGKKVAILPNNADMPDSGAEAIAAFMGSGGKLVSFYLIPDQLKNLVPIRMEKFIKQEYSGQFASIHAKDGILPGLPAITGQASWNIFRARPASKSARIAAYWYDERGRNTGEPAIIVTTRGIHMTHVLLSDDPANKSRMLLAMIGHFMPGAWKQAATDETRKVGVFGPYSSMEQARTGIKAARTGNDEITALIARASGSKQEADRLLKTGRYEAAFEAAADARAHMIRAYCMTRRPLQGEFRGAWCHTPLGIPEMSWDSAIANLASNGFTAIFPNISWAGTAYYRSTVLAEAPEVGIRGDQLAECLKACRKYGVQCHAWKVCWNMARRTPDDFVRSMKRAGRTQVNSAGRREDSWLCPSNPDNRALEVAAIAELAANYDLDGIHLDYIRYPGAEFCFCAGCRKRFEQRLGTNIRNWPGDALTGGRLRREWLDFRRDNITALVTEAGAAARRARPGIKLSVAVFTDLEICRNDIGQDWKTWCDKRLVDFVCPMDYTADTGEFAGMVSQQQSWCGKTRLYPGIGVSTWPPSDRMIKLIEQVDVTRKAGTGGFMLFNYGYSEAAEIVPQCGLGLTKRQK